MRKSRRSNQVTIAISASEKENFRKAFGSSSRSSTVWRGKKVGIYYLDTRTIEMGLP
jgi:hypothetical protein